MDSTHLRLYNSDGQRLEIFKPRRPGKVRMYCCGPTVYNYAHIGNLRAYTVQDTLRRCLLGLGYQLEHVMNITDVGHLTDDADDGEDKMLLSARSTGKSVQDIADYYTRAFFRDCAALRIERPETICRATEHIAEMQELIRQIEAAGYTYYNSGNLYFDTGKLGDYGRLAGLERIAEQEAQSRTGADNAKKNQRDFVLWFSNGKFADQAMQWDSPWGRGYPGWHIECSAMARHFLGEQIDIHCGGVDHKTVHHSNEIAQSESILTAEQKPWVHFWLHNEFVVMKDVDNQMEETSETGVEGGKISKSSGAALTLQNLKQQGFDPLDYRYFLLGSHYRSQIQFHFQAMTGARNSRLRLQQKAAELRAKLKNCEPVLQTRHVAEKLHRLGNVRNNGPEHKAENSHLCEFWAALLQDLNTAQALAVLWNSVKDSSLSPQQKFEVLELGETFLQIGLFDEPQVDAAESQEVPPQFVKLLARRDEARKNKDYARADQLRTELNAAGYQIVDTANGSVLQKPHS